MIERRLTIDGREWKVSLAGRFTAYERDEFPLVFERTAADGTRERRLARFSPLGSRSRERALAELTDAELAELLGQSQESWTSPELGYVRR
ncbi:MAG TPA: hypothetical protein VEH62_04210 [Gemmatimonadales bacterium]|nr:hypothetical protein [Gemmatimonadales bacterium]